MEKPRKSLAVLLGGALAAGALYTGVASASKSQSTSPRPAQAHVVQKGEVKGAAVEESSSPDTDNIQQGDQSAPDNTRSVKSGKAETQEATGSETSAPDGPGGHADPAGSVDHQFEGQE